jgi:hypothetical protein
MLRIHLRVSNRFPVVLVIGIRSIWKSTPCESSVAIPMSFASGAFFGVLWVFVFGPFAKRRIEDNTAMKNAEKDAADVNKSFGGVSLVSS